VETIKKMRGLEVAGINRTGKEAAAATMVLHMDGDMASKTRIGRTVTMEETHLIIKTGIMNGIAATGDHQ
jgi:hypothetical protein